MTERSEQPVRIAFGELLDHLRAKGFVIGLDQQLRLQQLLARIEGQCSPQDLRTLLCPIIASNRKQQEEFYEEFDRFYPLFALREDLPNDLPQPEPDPAPAPLPARWSWQRAALGVAALVVAVVLVLLVNRQQQKTTTAIGPEPSPTPTVSPSPTPDRPNSQVVSVTVGGEVQGSSTPPLPPPEPPFAIRHRKELRGVAVLLPLVAFLLWMAWRWWRQRPVIEKGQGRRPPFSVPIDLKPERWRIDHLPVFNQAARTMRRRQLNEQSRLDLPATIEATVAAQGYPRFRYRRGDRLPEYLILIQRVSPRDHQAEWFAEIARSLARSDLFVQTWFYQQDPRVCRSAETGEMAYLTQLQRRYPGHRLIILGDGRRLLDPLNGELAPWTELLLEWPEAAILTPLSPLAWNRFEANLEQAIPVFPATLDGLARLADHYDQPLRDSEPVIDPTERLTPDVEYGVTLTDLESYLGVEGYRWLCACAFFPELHWDLTLSLARLAPGGDVADERLLWRLIRLPWFREGSIPDEIRLPLIAATERTDDDRARAVREHLIGILEAQKVDEGTFAADERRLDIVVQRAALARNRRERLKALREIEHLSPGELRRDYALIRLIEEKPTTLLSLILPARLRKVFYPDGLPVYPLKWWAGLILAALVALGTLAGIEGIVRYQQSRVDQQPPVPTNTPQPVVSPTIPPSPTPGVTRRVTPSPSPVAPGPGNQKVVVRTAELTSQEIKVSFEMVTVSGGSFMMGSPPDEQGRDADEGPQHRVTLRSFEIGKHEVTQELWQAVMGSNPSRFKGDNLPVENVSWNDVQEFCRRLNEKLGLTGSNGYRLPTEAEWEYAARAGTTTPFAFGQTISPDIVNYDGNYPYGNGPKGLYREKTVPVGSLGRANDWGIHDMHGNVWEWCEDHWHDNY
ncbi:MAG: formylglycine-generating enzyme family protein, partial [Blastocatellia bacterium]